MLVEAFVGIYFTANARVSPCDDPQTKFICYAICVLTILRVSHLVFMFLFITLCFPCYICPDNCFIKRWLVTTEGAPKYLIPNLLRNWTWKFAERSKSRSYSKNIANSDSSAGKKSDASCSDDS